MSFIVKLDSWSSPASKYPRKQVGKAAIRTYFYKPAAYECYGVRNHRYFRATKRLRITNLKIDGTTWMVDDPPHWWAMEEHAAKLEGHVVCAGLGLGLIVHALAANPKVTRITVVEIDRDVIDLIKPLVPDCEIIHGDFWNWKGKPDGVLFDLLLGQGRNLVTTAVSAFLDLRQRFKSAKKVLIHGMNNQYLEETTTEMLTVADTSAELVASGLPLPEVVKRVRKLLEVK